MRKMSKLTKSPDQPLTLKLEYQMDKAPKSALAKIVYDKTLAMRQTVDQLDKDPKNHVLLNDILSMSRSLARFLEQQVTITSRLEGVDDHYVHNPAQVEAA